jgi:hypothetical protein
MIDFRIADPRPNSRSAHRVAFPLFADQLLVLQASNSLMIFSRACACVYVLGVGRGGSRRRDPQL